MSRRSRAGLDGQPPGRLASFGRFHAHDAEELPPCRVASCSSEGGRSLRARPPRRDTLGTHSRFWVIVQ